MFRYSVIWRCLLVFWCAGLVLICADKAFCAANSGAMHGVWVIELESTPKEDLQVYFGGNDEQDILAKASSTIFTFDLEKMRFSRKMSGKETIRRIREIAEDQADPEKFILWMEQVKFPDYIVALPDGRLRYGSTWANPWEFILRRQ